MQLLHISTALSWRGGEQQLAYLIDGLRYKKLSQYVYCFKHSEIEKYCQKQEIACITHARKSAFNPLLIFDIAKKCDELNIKIIHAHDAHAHTLAVLSCALFGNKVQIVLSRKVDFPIKNNFFSRYKYNHPAIKKIICVSAKIAKIIAPEIRNKKVLCTIYDGIDLSRFQHKSTALLRDEYSIPTGELIIGNIAAIAAHKDYFTFVDVAEIVLSKNISATFFIVGDGPNKKEIEQYVKDKKLAHKIILTGFRKDVPQILPEFDILLFTSKTEGLGSSILDAYACKVPVVATQAGGIPEIVSHHETGLLSPIQQAAPLAANIEYLLAHPIDKKRMVENAFQFVQHFSKERMVDQSYKTYIELDS